jgi:glycosyltransferase involved in cell wall biosynthesis
MQAQMEASRPVTSPFFTVGLTTYKRPTLLVKAIQSVLAQSFTDYEFIVIDDASPDDTQQRIKQIGAPNLHYIRQQTNQGINPARNEIIKRAQGEFIVFLDDDDRLMPDYLRYVYQGWQTFPPTVAFAVTARSTYRLSDAGETLIETINYHVSATEVRTSEQFLQFPIGTGSGLSVNAEKARSIGGFDTARFMPEDTDFLLRMALRGDDMAVIPQAEFKVYSTTGTHVTTSSHWLGEARERLADRYRQKLYNYPQTLLRYYIGSARSYFAAKERTNARRCLRKAIQIAPFAYRTWRLWLLLEINRYLPLKIRRKLMAHPRHGYQP